MPMMLLNVLIVVLPLSISFAEPGRLWMAPAADGGDVRELLQITTPASGIWMASPVDAVDASPVRTASSPPSVGRRPPLVDLSKVDTCPGKSAAQPDCARVDHMNDGGDRLALGPGVLGHRGHQFQHGHVAPHGPSLRGRLQESAALPSPTPSAAGWMLHPRHSHRGGSWMPPPTARARGRACAGTPASTRSPDTSSWVSRPE